MTVNIEKMRQDIRMGQDDSRRQGRRDLVAILGLVVAAFAAGAAYVRFLHG